MSPHHKVPFTDEDDALLMKFIATYNPDTKGRLGKKLYERLVANVEGRWSFSSRHPVQSWRERYKTNQPRFDAKILRYQKKHGISAGPSSPRATGQSSAGRTHAVTGFSNNSPPLAGGNGSKKRAREVDATDLSPSPTKKMRRANVTVEMNRPGDPSSRSVPPPQNKGKLRAELLYPQCHEEDGDPPVIGADDYAGALDSESDRGEGSQSDDESPSPFPPSRSKPSNKMRNYRSPGRMMDPEESSQSPTSSSQQQHVHFSSVTATRPSAQPASKVPSPVRKLVITPPQLSQELTPPHTSALNSPSSPGGHSHTSGPSSQSGHSQRVAFPKQRRPLSLKRRIVQEEEEDDIFGTPPIRSPLSSPPLRVHTREAPRLVEGPFRSAFTLANGPAPHGQRASVVRKDVEVNGNKWPPRQDKRNAPTSSLERPTTKHVDREEEEEEEANSNEWPPRRDQRHASKSSPERSATKDVNRASASVQHIDLRVLHSRKSVESMRGSSAASFTSRALEKKRPRQARAPRSSTPPNLSEANKELVLALGLEEVYKRMAENHKFHVDIVRAVAARQRSLEHADRVLRNMREAAEQEYERLLKQEFIGTGGTHQTEESDEEEEEEVAESLRNEEHGRSALSQPAPPRSNHSLSRADGGMEVDADAVQELDDVPMNQADSSLPGSPALPNMEWKDDDDELLLDGDLAAHEELVRRKGLSSVKFRTAHLYSLLLDS